MRQQMEAKMLAKFNRAVAPPAMMQGLQGRSVYRAQEERAEAQVCMHVSVCLCLCVSLYIHICIYIYIYIFVYVCVCVDI